MTEMNVNVEIIFYSCLYYQWNPPKQTVPSELFGKKTEMTPHTFHGHFHDLVVLNDISVSQHLQKSLFSLKSFDTAIVV